MKLSALTETPQRDDPEIVGITDDSRAVRPGFLFAALPGGAVDGAGFIPQAEEQGAAAVLARPGTRTRVPLVSDPDPRRALARLCARFWPRQPQRVAGVTGTNGKTSTVRFAAQIWTALGRQAGSVGTLGADAPSFHAGLKHTTPDPVTLHRTLDEMSVTGVTHAAIEVSSHALDQRRADGVRFFCAAFTNLTQDHLDYHGDLSAYFAAKLRLFEELLPPDATAVVNADGEGARKIISAARRRNLQTITTGRAGETLTLKDARPRADGLAIKVTHADRTVDLDLPLVGAFQADNALLAAGIALASGESAEPALRCLTLLQGVPGRMQRVASARGGAIYVDYAHTPAAIERALTAIRPHATGKLVAIVGAGGDRDRAKRPLMGEAASRFADCVIVTDDNPRSEEPAAIRREVLKGAPSAMEIGDRAEAICKGVAMLGPGDILLIAGKGHETGQIVGARTLPFDDAATARRAALELGGVAA